MNIKLHCVFYVLLYIFGNSASETEDDSTEIYFDNEEANQTTNALEAFQNYLNFDIENLPKPNASKESFVREIILNSMKSDDMKEKVARVLPILRVMTPQQKLALASLVTSQVLTPIDDKGLTLDEVTNLFGNNPNTTAELMLPISLDVANMFRTARSEKGPTAEELRAPLKRPTGVFRRNIIERAQNKFFRPRKPPKIINKETPNCELFSSNICLSSHDYPIEAILSSIRRNKHAMGALLTDFKVSPQEELSESNISTNEHTYYPDDTTNEVRRTGAENGFMCPSIIRYARPQKARSTSGQWKYIVNTGDHTQTLRLERCMKAGESCTYLTENFKSRCVQVYNYHRLLTWDQTNGLHMDIFKVPTCCSCHVDSYKVPFPPHHANHATTSEAFPGEEIENEQILATSTEQEYVAKGKPISPFYHDVSHELDYGDISYQPEPTKLRPSINNRPGTLPKYLEAPKPQPPYPKPTVNQNFKRSNSPKPGHKRPSRPIRRRQPSKPVRDLTESESSFGHITTELPVSSSTSTITKDLNRKINYNYHPIIDFFKPDQLESRMDIDIGDSEWRPVTSMLLPTERSHYQK